MQADKHLSEAPVHNRLRFDLASDQDRRMWGPQVVGVAYGDDYGETAARAMEAAIQQVAAEGFAPPNIWHFGHREDSVGRAGCWNFAVCALGRL